MSPPTAPYLQLFHVFILLFVDVIIREQHLQACAGKHGEHSHSEFQGGPAPPNSGAKHTKNVQFHGVERLRAGGKGGRVVVGSCREWQRLNPAFVLQCQPRPLQLFP